MGKDTGISWTDHTFNPWWGCVRVSPGCKHCYAADLAGRFGQGWSPTSERRFMTAAWNDPPKWNRAAQKAGKPAFVFCASMADIFEDVPAHVREQTEAARVRLWALIADTPWLVWLLLTKRPERVAEVVPAEWVRHAGARIVWPRNVWVGCTVEDLEHAEKRLPHLLALPDCKRFVSYEPALGPVDWRPWGWSQARCLACGLGMDKSGRCLRCNGEEWHMSGIDWLIIGGESGRNARPFQAQWARSAIRQCREARTAVWMKQAGADPRDDARGEMGDSAWPGGIRALPHPGGGGILRGFGPVLRDRAGADPAEWPADLRVQERPAPEAVL